MAKGWRTIKFTYDTNTYQIDVNIDNEVVTFQEQATTRRTLDGTFYEQFTSTAEKRNFVYNYIRDVDTDIFDFWIAARTASRTGSTITMEREQDDGTFESFEVKLRPVFYDESNVTSSTTQKTYSNLSVTVNEV